MPLSPPYGSSHAAVRGIAGVVLMVLAGCVPLRTVYFTGGIYSDSAGVKTVASEEEVCQYLMPVPPMETPGRTCIVRADPDLRRWRAVTRLHYDVPRLTVAWSRPVPVLDEDEYAWFGVGSEAEHPDDLVLRTAPLTANGSPHTTRVGVAAFPPGTYNDDLSQRRLNECFFTCSGRHALVLSRDDVSIWDVVAGRRIYCETVGRLFDLWRQQVQYNRSHGRGYRPDHWILSDDLRYVVYLPAPRQDDVIATVQATGSGSYDRPYPKISVSDLTLDPNFQGAVVDRADNSIRIFGRPADPRPFGEWLSRPDPPIVPSSVTTAESVGGRLLFLTQRFGPEWSLQDEAGDEIYRMPPGDRDYQFSSWDTVNGKLCFDSVKRPPHRDGPTDQPVEFAVRVWEPASGKVTDRTIKPDEVRGWLGQPCPEVQLP